MKNNLVVSGIGALAATLLISSFTFSEIQDQKKTRHVKLTKVENGKTMHLDTVLNGDDVFIWNGDTIGPEKHTRKFSPSEFDRRYNTDRTDRQKRVKIYQHRPGMEGDHLIMHGDSGEDFQIITHDGDSANEKIIIRKRMNGDQDEDHVIYLKGHDGEDFPPMPPMPHRPHVKMFKADRSARSINLNDPNIISFKKKDIGGGREKIEIIRKKTNEKESFGEHFDFNMDHSFDVPTPPIPPMPEEHGLIEKEIKIEKQKEKAEAEKDSASTKKSEKEENK